MRFMILNNAFRTVCVLDDYISIIWTDRYQTAGDFEVVIPVNCLSASYVKKNYYVTNSESEHVMVIEQISTSTDIDDGTQVTFSGRSLESVLDRRIIWGLKTVHTQLQTAVRSILNECFISPSIAKRKVNNFTFASSSDVRITGLTTRKQWTGDNVYDVICDLCAQYDVGFKMVLNSNNNIVFSLYKGIDRSYEQTDNPYVIFSPTFDNLINAEYTESNTELKNVTLVGGEGEGKDRRYTSIGDSSKGLNRREIFTDARDIQSEVDEGETLSNSEYLELLKERGQTTLDGCKDTKAFEGKAETSSMFRIGSDFFLGDIVQVDDGYGHSSPAVVGEIVMSDDVNDGSSMYPTFSLLNDFDDTRYRSVNASLQDSNGGYILDNNGEVIKTRALYEITDNGKIGLEDTLDDHSGENIIDSYDFPIETEVYYDE